LEASLVEKSAEFVNLQADRLLVKEQTLSFYRTVSQECCLPIDRLTNKPPPMFNRDKITSDNPSNKATLISAGTEVRGDINSDHDLRIDGAVFGNVRSSARIVVGPNGSIEGDIESQQADVTGRVTGNIKVRDLLQLRGECVVEGNIAAGKLQIEPTATFNGQCHMGAGSIVQLKVPETKQRTKANEPQQRAAEV
jgi:cytoskeletal protein CcmA (bactofilin family)